MTLSFWQKDDLGAPIQCDIAIVGAGIIGCSTAYWLKKYQPQLDIILIDSRKPGFGASGRNAGFLLQGASVDYVTDIQRFGKKNAEALWQFTLENRELIASEFNPEQILLEPTGSLLLAGSPAENARLIASAEHLSDRGVMADYLDSGEVAAATGGVGFEGGLRIASGAGIHSMRLIKEIAGRSGARLLEQHPVFAIEESASGIVLRTPVRNIEARRTILTLNAYLPRLLPEAASIIHPVRAQMLSSRPSTPWLRYPIYSHEGYYYLRQAQDGSLLLGGARHLFVDEEVGYDDTTTEHLQQSLEGYLTRHFPDATPLEIDRRWSGVMGFTAGGLPVINTKRETCWWAAGFNGHGMGYGFRFGLLLAQMHLGLETEGFEGLFTSASINELD